MEFRLTRVSVILPVTVGALNQVRRQRLMDILKPYYPLLGQQEHGQGLAFMGGTPGDLLAVEARRIVFAKDAITGITTFPLEQWADVATSIFQDLLLDTPSEVGVHLTGLTPAPNGDSMSASCKLLPITDALRVFLPNLRGVGFRLLIEDRGGVRGEFKIEPYIADPKQYFFELMKSVSHSGDWKAAFSNVSAELDRFRSWVSSTVDVIT